MECWIPARGGDPGKLAPKSTTIADPGLVRTFSKDPLIAGLRLVPWFDPDSLTLAINRKSFPHGIVWPVAIGLSPVVPPISLLPATIQSGRRRPSGAREVAERLDGLAQKRGWTWRPPLADGQLHWTRRSIVAAGFGRRQGAGVEVFGCHLNPQPLKFFL